MENLTTFRASSSPPASRLFLPRLDRPLDFFIGNGALRISIGEATRDHVRECQFPKYFLKRAVVWLPSNNLGHGLFDGWHLLLRSSCTRLLSDYCIASTLLAIGARECLGCKGFARTLRSNPFAGYNIPCHSPRRAADSSMFFSIDGGDGAGKSTQIERFCQWLRDEGHAVVCCRDPGSTPLGEAVRDMLLHRSDLAIDRMSEMLLYMAARAQLVSEVIRPALEAGKIVVSDRYLLANIAYQGYGGRLDVPMLREIGRIATGGLMPDLTMVLDLPVDAAAARIRRAPTAWSGRGPTSTPASAKVFSPRPAASPPHRDHRRRPAGRARAGRLAACGPAGAA